MITITVTLTLTLTLRTDNSALKFLDSVKHITERLGRWHMLLAGYKYRIEHIKGTKNIVADTLSRTELPTNSDKNAENLDDKTANINTISDVTLDGNLQDRSEHVWAITLGEPTSVIKPMAMRLLRQTRKLKTI